MAMSECLEQVLAVLPFMNVILIMSLKEYLLPDSVVTTGNGIMKHRHVNVRVDDCVN